MLLGVSRLVTRASTGAPPLGPPPVFGSVTVTLTRDQLRVSAELGRTGTLAPRQYDSFSATWTDDIGGAAAIVFMPDGAGGVRALRAFGATFERVATGAPGTLRP